MDVFGRWKIAEAEGSRRNRLLEIGEVGALLCDIEGWQDRPVAACNIFLDADNANDSAWSDACS